MNTNVLTMVPAVGSSLALIGTSHNDGGRVAAGYYADLDTLITSVKSRLPNAAIGIFSEIRRPHRNRLSASMGHNRRRAALSGYAAQRSYTMYDPYSAFVDGSGAVIAGLVSGDGVHPTTTGSQAWASYMSDAFDRRR